MLPSSQKIITALAIVGLSTAATMAIAEQVAPPALMERHGPWGICAPI
jgi:invasion protein IalB